MKTPVHHTHAQVHMINSVWDQTPQPSAIKLAAQDPNMGLWAKVDVHFHRYRLSSKQFHRWRSSKAESDSTPQCCKGSSTEQVWPPSFTPSKKKIGKKMGRWLSKGYFPLPQSLCGCVAYHVELAEIYGKHPDYRAPQFELGFISLAKNRGKTVDLFVSDRPATITFSDLFVGNRGRWAYHGFRPMSRKWMSAVVLFTVHDGYE